MKTLCIYHSRDLDGFCSAAIVQYWFEKTKQKGELYLIGWDYGDPIPQNLIDDSDKIIMCDVSFDFEKMAYIQYVYEDQFIYIDHHVSAIKDLENELLYKINGVQDTSKAACELTWEYFFPNDDMPEFVWYLGMYDSFRHRSTEHEHNVLLYQYAARSLIKDPEEAYWYLTEWSDDKLTPTMLHSGSFIFGYAKTMAEESIKRAFGMIIKGKKFLAVDENRLNPSKFGIDYHAMGFEGFASFWYRPQIGKWEFSLYSDDGKTDVSVIAKELGGGGHFGAAGFTVPDIEDFIKYNKMI